MTLAGVHRVSVCIHGCIVLICAYAATVVPAIALVMGWSLWCGATSTTFLMRHYRASNAPKPGPRI